MRHAGAVCVFVRHSAGWGASLTPEGSPAIALCWQRPRWDAAFSPPPSLLPACHCSCQKLCYPQKQAPFLRPVPLHRSPWCWGPRKAAGGPLALGRPPLLTLQAPRASLLSSAASTGGLTASGSGVQPKPTFPGPHAGDLSWPQTGLCRRVLAAPSACGHAPLTPGTNCHGPEGLSSAEPPQPQPRDASAEQRWEVQETPCPPAGGPRRPDPQCAPLPRALLRARSAWTRREGGKPSPTLLPLHGAGRAPSISFHPSLEDCCNISF